MVDAVSIPDTNALALLKPETRANSVRDILSPDHALEKRKGGGGKGGGGGGGGSKSGGSNSGGGGGGGRSSSSSNAGGATKSGSGVRPAYGGYYGGGASVPHTAGKKSHKGLFAGALLLPAAALLIFPGLWLYSVYPYHYNNPYRFYNRSGNINDTLPVVCLCQEFSVCGCDDNDDSRYFDSLVGDGSYARLNKSLVTVSEVNGTRSLVINGTLPNGTTAPGGSDSGAPMRPVHFSGYFVMIALVISTVVFL